MHDIRTIRDNPKNFDAALKRRCIDKISNKIIEIDQERRAKITSAEAALATVSYTHLTLPTKA